MPDQNAPPALTHEALIKAIDAAASGASTQAQSSIKTIRKRLPDFFARHRRMPATLKELASLEVAELTRFKTIAKDGVELSGGSISDPEIAKWKLTQFFQRTVNLTDADILSIPNIGDATVGVFRFMTNLYTSLGLLTELDVSLGAVSSARAPLVTAWREASAGLDKMNVVDRLGLLLEQKDDIIAANSRGYFKALEQATEEYYGTLLTENLIGSKSNLIVTRHVVAKHTEEARRGRNTKTVLHPYIGGLARAHELAFTRSYIAVIHDDIKQGDLDVLSLKIKMLGLLNLKNPERQGEESDIIRQTKLVARELVAMVSRGFDDCVKSGRIADALEIMDVLKNKVSDAVVVSSDSFQKLLDAVVARHAEYPPPQYQELHETLMAVAKHREGLKQLTPAHTAKLQDMSGAESAVRQAAIDRLAARLTATPANRNEKT